MSIADRVQPAWLTLIQRHRPLVILLPASLIVSWTAALAHGATAVAPTSQGILAGALTTLADSPAWRLVWWLWLAGTLVLLESLGRRYRATDHAIVAVGMVLIALPVTFWAFGWAGTDGPLMCFGALALWLATRFADGIGSGWWLVGCGLLAGAFGVTSVLAFLVVLILLVGVAIVRPGRSLRLVGTGVAALLAALVLPLIAALAGLGTAPGSTAIPTGGATLGPLGGAIAALNAMVTTGFYTVTQRGIGLPGAPEYFFQLLGWVLVAGAVVAFLRARRTNTDGPLAVAVAVTIIVAGPILTVLASALAGEWVMLQPVGMSAFLPALVLVTATVIRNRPAGWLVIGWSAVVAIVGIVLAVTATG